MKKIKQKKCRVCGDSFTPRNTLQVACSPLCAIQYAKQKLEEKQKRQNAAQKKAFNLNDRGLQTKLAQAAFNAFIRKRDEKEPCISCGRHHTGKYDAGHYLSVGAHPELRFDERNNNKQCVPCNHNLSGNVARYRINLIAKIGIEAVEELEGPHEPIKLSVAEIVEIKEKYKRKLKEL